VDGAPGGRVIRGALSPDQYRVTEPSGNPRLPVPDSRPKHPQRPRNR